MIITKIFFKQRQGIFATSNTKIMLQLSIVIITKNEAHNIVACIRSAKKLGTDVIVVDSGSDDDTVLLAEACGARVKHITWSSYGAARNAGAALAKNDWIFALDADERITDELVECVKDPGFFQAKTIYGFHRTNFFKGKKLQFGNLGRETVFRLYNRRLTEWNNDPVHEKLHLKSGNKLILKSSLLHFGIEDIRKYQLKKLNYAYLCALKYRSQGKKGAVFFKLVSPVFHFVQSYFIRLGFLDGKAGLLAAKINANYTWHKYDNLSRMKKLDYKKPTAIPTISSTFTKAYSS